jgi:signal transduction histidine kinase
VETGFRGYDQSVGLRSFVHARRTERTVVALRAAVLLLVALHVFLIAGELDAASVFGYGSLSLFVLGGSALFSFISILFASRPSSLALAGWICAVLDAFSLITLARLTIAIDPTASIAWAFVLWVPFSIAVRAAPVRALLGTLATSAGVYAACMWTPGNTPALEQEWTSIGVPMLLVAFGGLTSVLALLHHHRFRAHVRRELLDERDRTTRLREADDLKNTFLAAVSHELRTPLTSILGFSLTMLDRPELDDEQRERMLRTVVMEAEHLEDILANLLDLDRLTRGKATLVPVELDPARVVTGAVEHVRRRSGRAIHVDVQDGQRVWLDAAKVERIVENLVGNAVKYTPVGADIRVTLQADRAGVRIRVDDGGPGIGAELREAIFEPFKRGTQVGVPGTGIGLSLVDRFNRMHGGKAWLEERPGGGCRFQVYLPSVRDAGHVAAARELSIAEPLPAAMHSVAAD